ncbi:hypothetical protein HPB50_006146 [Hyalomma asiaticum]|uniref:Uncharacterized protein n=1 Tax=Hyalomma asiaticum TaxID=266040 RepID=A0ACB7TD79_HYAAI|nr:hypothetical protein HPB50_006146 [Hyalomma asiaticum]
MPLYFVTEASTGSSTQCHEGADEGVDLPPCSFGPKECHKITQTKKKYLVNVQDLTEPQRRLLFLRAKQTHQTQGINTVYGHHYMVYLKKYTSLVASRWCSNQFLEHTTNFRGTSVITLSLVDMQPSLELIPGQRLCQRCVRRCYHTTSRQTSRQRSLAVCIQIQDQAAVSPTHDPATLPDGVNEALVAVGASPVRRKRARGRREAYVENKAKKLQMNLKERMRTYLGLSETSSTIKEAEQDIFLNDYVSLLDELKKKFKEGGTRQNKVQILTLAPKSWSRNKIMKFFGASERLVREAVKLKSDCGVLSVPPRKKGRPLSEEVSYSIQQFYEDDSVSHCLPVVVCFVFFIDVILFLQLRVIIYFLYIFFFVII